MRDELISYLRERFGKVEFVPLAGDASTRKFYRLVKDESTLVVMDYGNRFEGEPADIIIGRLFRNADLPVASVVDSSPEAGCLVLEDLGDITMEKALDAGADHYEIYRRAVRLARDLAVRGTPLLSGGAVLDSKRFRFEMDFFLENYVKRLRKIDVVEDRIREVLNDLADRAAESPRLILCHRDFHSRNLMVRPDGSLVMVDIQDARWGPDSYDLASLLRDSYVEIDEELVDRMVDEYLAACGWDEDPVQFRGRFDIVSLQRMIKALGTFGHQASKLGNSRYLEGVPRTLTRINRLLGCRTGTEDLQELFDLPGF